MKYLLKIVIPISLIASIIWGTKNTNEAKKYKNLYNKSDFIINEIIDKHPQVYKYYKDASNVYEDIQSDKESNQYTGLDN